MTEHICQVVSREELVAYADGELSPTEAERIAEHVASCPDCQAVTEALKRSLEITRALWRTSEAHWPKTVSLRRLQSRKWSLRKMAAVATGIFLVFGVTVVWRIVSRPTGRAGISLQREEALAVEIKRKIADSADAARLLAATELLSKYPEAESSVKERYRHIVEMYPETAAAAKATLKVQ